MDRNVDVLVIGAGPAGLAAAVRTRWVKGHSAISLKTAILECGVPGGLVAWRGSYITGPGFYLRGEDFLDRLMADVDTYNIPVCRERALSIHRGGSRRLTVQTDVGEWATDAIILALGLRAQGQESQFFGKGVQLTYMGYDHLAKLFDRMVSSLSANSTVAILGNARTVLLAPVLREMSLRHSLQLTFVLGGAYDAAAESRLRQLGSVVWGTYHSIEGSGPFQIGLELSDTTRSNLVCASVLVDYNAYELQPEAGLRGEPHRDAAGFYRTDPVGRTSDAFVYAAGDILGGYAMVAGALATGINAGFAAYEDLYCERFGQAPSMFAYKPSPVELSADYRALPYWQAADIIEWLVPLASVDLSIPHLMPIDISQVPRSSFVFGDLVDAFGPTASDVLDSWVQRKLVTVRRVPAQANHA